MDETLVKKLVDQLVYAVGGTAPAPDRVPEKNVGQLPQHDGKFVTADYWVENRFGVMKGSSVQVVNDYNVVMSAIMSGSGIPFHMSVCIPGTALGSCIATAADVGWMNRDDWVWIKGDPGNYARWIRCGCPHFTSDGRRWAAGEPSDDSQWVALYERMKELGKA